jgi:hypothetical protein
MRDKTNQISNQHFPRRKLMSTMALTNQPGGEHPSVSTNKDVVSFFIDIYRIGGGGLKLGGYRSGGVSQ